uniref:Integrase catalytic domain-containing protein n=1 Tax=Arundo donax TaxID=35708 RepID=A0A0A9DEM9_ARUDO
MSTTFHLQSDGQTEAVNKVIAMYLRCMTGDQPKQWVHWLPWAEYVYNMSFHSALRDTPFHVVYCCDPPSIRSYANRDIRVVAVARSMEEHDEFLANVKACLELAQQHAKRTYDKGHRGVMFSVGNWVWLHLRHRSPLSIADIAGKLNPRFYGPYQVIVQVNEVCSGWLCRLEHVFMMSSTSGS